MVDFLKLKRSQILILKNQLVGLEFLINKDNGNPNFEKIALGSLIVFKDLQQFLLTMIYIRDGRGILSLEYFSTHAFSNDHGVSVLVWEYFDYFIAISGEKKYLLPFLKDSTIKMRQFYARNGVYKQIVQKAESYGLDEIC